MVLLILIFLTSLGFSLGAESNCSDVPIHFNKDGLKYHFSWKVLPDKAFTWSQGRKYCQKLCMDLVALNKESHWKTVVEIFKKENLKWTWTAGRKCNYAGCTNPSLQPVIENGWFWATNKSRIPNPFTGACKYCEWSPKGALGKRQPDNRQGVNENIDEGCLAILNNIYKDGIKWHDVACFHKKPIICRGL